MTSSEGLMQRSAFCGAIFNRPPGLICRTTIPAQGPVSLGRTNHAGISRTDHKCSRKTFSIQPHAAAVLSREFPSAGSPFNSGAVLQMGIEHFQEEQMIGVRTTPRHNRDHNNNNNSDPQQRGWKNREHICSRPFLMLRPQCYAEIKVKYATSVITVTRAEPVFVAAPQPR